MKAYEFYVLLGKYKRKSLSRSDYDRFCKVIATVRGFRSTFHESTGESYPVFPERHRSQHRSSTTATSDSKPFLDPKPGKQKTEAHMIPSNESVEQSWSGSGNRQRSERMVTDVIEQHRVFKRVRSQRRRRLRWFRLLRDVLKHHPFLIFLVTVLLIALVMLSTLHGGGGSQPSHLSQPAALQTLNPDAAVSDAMAATVSGGRLVSEADQLLSVHPNAFEWEMDPAEPLQVPITGLEQAIREGLKARFPEPQPLLREVLTPGSNPIESMPTPAQP